MALTISNLVPASTKAKNVATEEYVDTGLANIDVSGDITSNNETFAQKLGYANYAEMVAAASSGQTVINGGYFNTSLIQASTILANMINTQGLIAENISADSIVGKILEGGVINGARINGAVIKASYLDLDGELEVLTNYHLCTSQTQLDAVINAGGTGRLVVDADKLEFGGDAVYIEIDDEYRIPSLSRIYESTQIQDMAVGDTLNSSIWSYDTVDSGTNNKAVRKDPGVIVAQDTDIMLYEGYAKSTFSSPLNYTVRVGNDSFTLTVPNSGAAPYFDIWQNDSNKGVVMVSGDVYVDGSSVFSGIVISAQDSNEGTYPHMINTGSSTFTKFGVTFRLDVTIEGAIQYYTLDYYGKFTYKLSIISSSSGYTLANDFISNNLVQITCNSLLSGPQTVVNSSKAYLSNSIQINNML